MVSIYGLASVPGLALELLSLGNSPNISALRTIQFVGSAHYLSCLHALRLTTINQHPDFYGDGLALGNGEVSLRALV